MKTLVSIIFSMLFGAVSIAQTFQDNVTNEVMGEFPSQWDLVAGMATVDQQDGYKFINFSHGSIIKPIINEQTDNYLSDDFTVEFDMFFGLTSSIYGQRVEIRFWDGIYGYRQDDIVYKPIIIKRDGLETSWEHPQSGHAKNFVKELHTLEPVWRHVKIECKTSKLKIYLDERLVLNIPRFKMQPSMVSIGGKINDSRHDAKVGITNVTITGLSIQNQTQEDIGEPHTESDILATNTQTPGITSTTNTTGTENTNMTVDNQGTGTNSGETNSHTTAQHTGQIQTTINETPEIPIDKDSIRIYTPYEPLVVSTNPQLTPLEIEKPRILKITVTDLLCIDERDSGDNPDDYALQLFSYFKDSSADYDQFFHYDNNIDCNVAVPGGDLLVCGDMDNQIHVEKGNTRIGNFTNASLYYELDNAHYTMDAVNDIKFFIWLKEYTNNNHQILFNGSIKVKIKELLNHLLIQKFPDNSNLVQYYDTSITTLNDFYEYGSRGSFMWLRFTSRKTLEGPIRLGNSHGKAAVWVEFELQNYYD
ncbi:hypothetical protein [Winogradskyella ouciana]|uniref:3-keto-disaccharide hydrolase domain-containing protein n=1 Tax=Winogradskyella ouciana TaxID=2608631 RepID=A0A7K1GAA1_9FLAO|nr:hypothetical protein [Winogradskyella ouciana]MTE26073.1 hypothetical protein [Winogradskyella ouciana]